MMTHERLDVMKDSIWDSSVNEFIELSARFASLTHLGWTAPLISQQTFKLKLRVQYEGTASLLTCLD